ncbi:MAG: TolC family protein [Candidatus Omnitrophica bacterium]|nr:TolC family protein [Candidatus Omnitrophota bacterium]
MKLLFRVLILFYLIYFYAGMQSYAQENTRYLNLSEALELALTQNVDVIIANERVNQALARIKENAAPLLPQLKGMVSETRQTRDLRSSGIALPGDPLVGPFNVYDARVRLTQTIFDPAAMSRFQSSKEGHLLSIAQQKKIKEDALILVAALFIEAKRAQDSLGVYQAALNQDKKAMGIIFSRLNLGTSSSLEMKKARLQYSRSLYNWQTAKKEALERRLDLAAVLALPQDENLLLVWDEQVLLKNTFDAKKPIVVAYDQPDVVVARQTLKVKEADRSIDKWDAWPKVAVSGDYGPSGVSPSNSSETYTLGVAASIPFFEGGIRQAKLKQSESEVKISQAQLENIERQVRAQLASQYAILSQAEVFLKQNENEMSVAQEEFQLAQKRFYSGSGNNLDLSAARVNVIFARDQRDEAIAYYFMAQLNIARSLGRVEEFALIEQEGK